jgi:hypothetical protein
MTGRTSTESAPAVAPASTPSVAAPAPRSMPTWRKTLVYAVLAVIVLGHLHEIVLQYEHWPFSNYPMWSRPIDSWDLYHQRMVGVTKGPDSHEVPLLKPYFDPLPGRFLELHLAGIIRDGRKGDLKPAQQLTADYLKRYEQRRLNKQHDGPELSGLRIYEDYWLMNNDASNKPTPGHVTLLFDTDHPDQAIPQQYEPAKNGAPRKGDKEGDDVDAN